MQKDDTPETLLCNDPPNNGICAYAFLPVFRIDRLANSEVLIPLCFLDRYKFLDTFAVRNRRYRGRNKIVVCPVRLSIISRVAFSSNIVRSG